jgi:GNAT superfamily N-acetyltransferase
MSNHLIAKNLDKSHIPQMTELFALAFKSPLKPELVNWKYFDNPAGIAIWIGILDNNKLLGSGAMIPEVLNVFGELKTVYKCTDLMIHPNYQGKGLASIVNKALLEQTQQINPPFSYTLCSKNATSNFVKNGWKPISSLTNLFKPKLMLQIENTFSSSENKNVRVITTGNIPNDFYFPRDVNIIEAAQNRPYFNWRMQNPNFNYMLLGYFSGESPIGYLLFSEGQSGNINLLNFEAPENDQHILKQLLGWLQNYAVTKNTRGVVGICIETNRFYENLKSLRFIKNPFNLGPMQSTIDFNILPGYSTNPHIQNLKSWNISGMMYDDI